MIAAAVLTISDSRSAGHRSDESGPAVEGLLGELNAECVHRAVIPDERRRIEDELRDWAPRVGLIVTTGGTGIAARDVTPEAVAGVIDRALPGFGEIMRTGTFDKTPLSIISRGGAGIAGKTLVVYLPGSPKAVRECLALVAPAVRHVLKVLNESGVDCAVEAAHANAPPAAGR